MDYESMNVLTGFMHVLAGFRRFDAKMRPIRLNLR